MANPNPQGWTEVAVVTDERTNLAARLFVRDQEGRRVPAVEVGHVDEGRFLPYLVPDVERHGEHARLGRVTIPDSLHEKIEEALRPHLATASTQLLGYELRELPARVRALGCLSCS